MDAYVVEGEVYRSEVGNFRVYEATSRNAKGAFLVKTYNRREIEAADVLAKEAVRQAQAGRVANCRLKDIVVVRPDYARMDYQLHLVYELLERRADLSVVQQDDSQAPHSGGLQNYELRQTLYSNSFTLMQLTEAISRSSQEVVIVKSFLSFDIAEASQHLREALVQAEVSAQCTKNCRLLDIAVESMSRGSKEVKVCIVMEKMHADLNQDVEGRAKSRNLYSEYELLAMMRDVMEGLLYAKKLVFMT